MTEKQSVFDFAELKTKADRLDHFRDSGARRQSRRRAKARDLKIPPVVDAARRGRGKNNPRYFLKTYFPHVFKNPFTADQRRMIRVIKDRLTFGGLQALAAARGDGKTSIAEGCAVWSVAYGHVDYTVILGPTSGHAKNILKDIKNLLEFSDLFAQDFPEIAVPIRALEGRPQNAGFQTVDGVQTRTTWSNEEIVLPTVAGSVASAAMIVTKGVEGSIRGLVRQGRRPGLILVDDLETTASAGSVTEINNRRDVVNKDVLGLAGPGQRIRVAYLCTIIRRDSLADELTDRTRSPAWNGIRQRFLLAPPTRTELWDKYQETRDQERIADETSRCRLSHAYYLANRREMDKGAKVNNPYRFRPPDPPDKTAPEISAIQHAMNEKFDLGVDAFESEYQNNPPDLGSESSGVTLAAVCQKLNHLERGIAPPWTEKLTAGIDVGSRVLHWSVLAWRNPGISTVVDYGTEKVDRPPDRLETPHLKKQMADAIFSALAGWSAWMFETAGYQKPDGSAVPLDLALVDSGWMPDAIYQFCRGRRGYIAAKGFGSLSGQTRYKSPVRPNVQQGPAWFVTRPGNRTTQIINFNADHFKNEIHSGFMATPGTAGSIDLFGSEPVHHKTFGSHILAESWVRRFVPGKGFDERFVMNSRANHYLDATALARVAGSVLNFRILADRSPPPSTGRTGGGTRQRVKLSERNKK